MAEEVLLLKSSRRKKWCGLVTYCNVHYTFPTNIVMSLNPQKPLEMLLARLSSNISSLLYLASGEVLWLQKYSLELGMTPVVFVESISHAGIQQSERRHTGCKEKQKESKTLVKGFIPRGHPVRY